MNLRPLFRVLRAERDLKAIAKGRAPQRVWNRGVSTVARRVARSLYR